MKAGKMLFKNFAIMSFNSQWAWPNGGQQNSNGQTQSGHPNDKGISKCVLLKLKLNSTVSLILSEEVGIMFFSFSGKQFNAHCFWFCQGHDFWLNNKNLFWSLPSQVVLSYNCSLKPDTMVNFVYDNVNALQKADIKYQQVSFVCTCVSLKSKDKLTVATTILRAVTIVKARLSRSRLQR